MPKAPSDLGYRIAKNYRSVTVWRFHPKTRAHVMTSTVTPDRGLSRTQRFEEVCACLKAFGLPIPDYKAR